MQAGDFVIVTRGGELQIIPGGAQDEASIKAAEKLGRVVGVVEEVRHPPDNSVVSVRIAQQGVEPPRATIGTMRRIYT